MMTETKTITAVLLQAAKKLASAGIDTSDLDAKLLLQHAAGFSNVEIISHANEFMDVQAQLAFEALIKRRLKHEPVHRIIGAREFYGRSFELGDETLIPRPDTEILVEAVVELKPSSILEIGTGSGAIAVTLAAELKEAQIVATDISKAALEIAQQNAIAQSVDNQIRFMEADVYEGLDGKFDVIISNPPYIPFGDINSLQNEVRDHDPLLALDGGEDGLRFYRAIFEDAANYLKADGKVLVEIGYDQANSLRKIAETHGFSEIVVIKDLGHNDRVVSATLKSANL